jgi:hypothetical protein
MTNQEFNMPEGEWRPKADDPTVMEWWGTSELLREVKEQIALHRSRVEILQDRIANGECTERIEPMDNLLYKLTPEEDKAWQDAIDADVKAMDSLAGLVHGGLMTAEEFLLVGLAKEAIRAGTQNASISHEVAPGATITTPPYPPYVFYEIDLPRASSEEK